MRIDLWPRWPTLAWALLLPALPALGMEDHDRTHYAGQLRYDQGSDNKHPQRWDGRLWVGGDIDRLLVRSEGEREDGTTTQHELQVLASHNISTFWDIQAGMRADRGHARRHYAVVGIEGLAPGRFDTELHAYASDDGDMALRIHQSVDVLLTQKLVLQPSLEINAGLHSSRRDRIGRGVRDSELGIRLRYDIRRELSPYVAWVRERQHGETADWQRAAGEHNASSHWQMGLQWRF